MVTCTKRWFLPVCRTRTKPVLGLWQFFLSVCLLIHLSSNFVHFGCIPLILHYNHLLCPFFLSRLKFMTALLLWIQGIVSCAWDRFLCSSLWISPVLLFLLLWSFFRLFYWTGDQEGDPSLCQTVRKLWGCCRDRVRGRWTVQGEAVFSATHSG